MNINDIERANPFGSVSNEKVDSQLKLISNEFGEAWINRNNGHPLQILWKRRDQISTLELYTFARAIEKIKVIDTTWLEHQKKIIKCDNVNNRKGAFWEIIGAYYLMDPKNEVFPAPASQKGFDLISRIRETRKEIRYSLKNYSFSEHYNLFVKRSQLIEKFIKTKLKEKKIASLQVLIAKLKDYPTEEEWNILDAIIDKMVADVKTDTIDMSFNYEDWLIGLKNLPAKIEEYNLSKKISSYTFFIHVPYHRNEVNNLLSNIHDAITNLKSANIKEDENSINSIFIHIPTTASIIQCWDWISEYYKQIGGNPVTRLILYQPSINFDFKRKITYLQHCMRVTENAERYDKWFNNDIRNKTEFWFETGIFNPRPFQYRMSFGGEYYDVKNAYTFQTGNIFVEPQELEGNKFFARFGKYVSGIHMHTVFKDKVITTPMESNDELLIL